MPLTMPPSLFEVIEKGLRGVFIPHLYVDLCEGDYMVAVVFKQITYRWHTGSSLVPHRGEWWIVRERKDWWEECRVTPLQFDRASERLQKLGFLKVGRFKSASHGMRPTLHIQLLIETIDQCLAEKFPNGLKVDSGVSVSSIPYSKDVEVQELHGEPSSQNLAGPKPSEKAGVGSKRYEKKSAKEWYMDAIEALAKVMDRTNKVQMKPTRSSLSMMWKKLISQVYPGEYLRDLTGKQQGQLGHLLRELGIQTPDLLYWVLQHWREFTEEVVFSGAAKGAQPSRPDLGYLLKHHAVAMNLMKSIDKAPAAVDNDQPAPTVATPAATQKGEVAPKEEVLAFLKELEQGP